VQEMPKMPAAAAAAIKTSRAAEVARSSCRRTAATASLVIHPRQAAYNHLHSMPTLYHRRSSSSSNSNSRSRSSSRPCSPH
jgi:hypothetical protein